MPASLPSVVFVCVENSNRSQMAEGFARRHGAERVDAWSAGSRPSGVVNPKAIAAMVDRGIDLTRQWSKGLDQLPDREWDFVVTMGCGDACPNLHAKQRADWDLPDPRNMEAREFAQVRDEIERRVVALLGEMIQESQSNV